MVLGEVTSTAHIDCQKVVRETVRYIGYDDTNKGGWMQDVLIPGASITETAAKTGMILLFGEISSKTHIDYQRVVRDTIKYVGYDDSAKGKMAASTNNRMTIVFCLSRDYFENGHDSTVWRNKFKSCRRLPKSCQGSDKIYRL